MKKLTETEDRIMQILWKCGKGFVNDLLEMHPEPKPAYNTISTIIRILEKKGFVDHKAYGRSHEYYPLISKDEYKRFFIDSVISGYFGNSYSGLVSFFAREEKVTAQELEDILRTIREQEANDGQ